MSNPIADEIFAIRPILHEVEVPEWHRSVWIRPVTLQEQGRLADAGHKFEKADPSARLKGTTVKLIIWVVSSDADGTLLFSEDQVPQIVKQPASVFLRLQDEILKLSGLTEDSRAAIEKNSETVPTDKLDS
jgi:hypothetical protein